jgi:methylphosphotriester-DNA--protein-cysteine methyltransferase
MRLELPRDRELDAGVWYSSPASSWYPTHWHDELELKLVLWGQVVYQLGPNRIELGPGSLLWISPGQDHTLAGLTDDLAMWVASFRPRVVREAELSSGVRILDQAFTWSTCVLPGARLEELSGRCATLARQEGPREVNLHAHRTVARALQAWQEQRLARGVDGPPCAARSHRHPAVNRACALLRGAENDLSLVGLARRCGLGASRLSRLFKQQMGLSVVQFRSHFRVQQFIARFGRGEQGTMLDAALDSGFGSYPQFHRAFHQVTGYAPSEHLRRVRAGIVVPTQQTLGTSVGGALQSGH